MARYLGKYPAGATNREVKFIRAVKSFINQSYEKKELIIVSDGCEITNKLWEEHFSSYENIKLIKLNKQSLYSGNMRNIAFDIAKGDVITYLDSDDAIGKTHLETINDQFNTDECDWVYYDDYMVLNKEFSKLHIRKVETRFGSIGTSAISHKHPKLLKNGDQLKWISGYCHDWIYVLKMNAMGLTFKKLEKMPQYLVCHYHNGDF
jgi:glycosyltransferase involved in cell wall biosynthesis